MPAAPAENEKERLTQQDFEMLADFRYALRQFLRMSENAAASAGLTPQQHQGMIAIRGYPGPSPITVGELAERLQLRHQSAVMLVDRLVILGLVKREQPMPDDDQRQIYLTLTDQGNATIERMTDSYREELYRLQPGLDKLCANLRGKRRPSAPEANTLEHQSLASLDRPLISK